MGIPESVLDKIDDDFYLYYALVGNEVLDFKWCGYVIVVNMPQNGTADKGSIEVYKGTEDCTPIFFPNKPVDEMIPATAWNFISVCNVVYKRVKGAKKSE